jgi:glutathione gamma-glutamylcysteinyltransferase
MIESVYRRPLPADLIAFSSAEGKALFTQALAAGGMDGYFALAEQFHTQSDPAFCGLGSLVVALNALAIDPGRLWKGPWRWFDEELLDCCVPLDQVRARGLTLDELACLAHCNGADAEVVRAGDADVAALNQAIAEAARGAGSVVIASYARSAMGQTGTGHYSPIAGLHPERELALVLDVARFKYPPHWVSMARLHQAMLAVDPDTQRSRGWLVLRRRSSPTSLLWFVSCAEVNWHDIGRVMASDLGPRVAAAAPTTAPEALRAAVSAVTEIAPFLRLRDPETPEHARAAAELRAELRATSAFGAAWSLMDQPSAELAAALVLVIPGAVWRALPEALARDIDALADIDRLPPGLRSEVEYVRSQLAHLCDLRDLIGRAAGGCATC